MAITAWTKKFGLSLRLLAGTVWLLSTAVTASADPGATLVLPEDAKVFSLAGYAEWAEVPGKQALSFSTMRHSANLDWQPLESHVLDLGFNANEHWVRFRLDNPNADHQRLIFDVAQPLHDYIDVFVLQDDVMVGYWYTGNRRPMATRPFPYRSMGFPLSLAAGESSTLYVRINNHDGLYDSLPLNLTTEDRFFQKQTVESLGFGFYYGAIVILLLYNLVVGLVNRERAFILYSVYLFFFLAWNLAFQGYLALWPLHNHPGLHNSAVAVLSLGIFAALIAFTRDFLQLKTRMPRTDKVMFWYSFILVIPLGFALFGHYAWVFLMQVPIAFMLMSMMMAVALHQSLKGHTPAQIFLAAWVVLMVAVLAHFGRLAGLFPSFWLFNNALNIGSLIEMLVLSYALAYRIIELKKQRQEDQVYLIRREQEMNESLQLKVESKTRELQNLATRLKHESITDALTGLHNRRTFFSTVKKELARLSRTERALCLAVMDIDDFKEINDEYGHPEGDRQLCLLADLIRQDWQREGDHSFRLGGDEFAILYWADDESDMGRARLENFQAKSRALAQASAANDAMGITVSFGVAVARPLDGLDENSFYARADNALYVSKGLGKNRLHYIDGTNRIAEGDTDLEPLYRHMKPD